MRLKYDNDKYLGFEFRGKHSKDFNAFIKNEGEDLRFYNPSFEVETVTPQFGGLTHYLGTTTNSREISFTVFAKEVDIDTYNKMIYAWFNEKNEPAYLAFDYNPNFGYKCVVSSIGDATFVPTIGCESGEVETKYNVTFDISFMTVGDWAANWFKKIEGTGDNTEDLILSISKRGFPEYEINSKTNFYSDILEIAWYANTSLLSIKNKKPYSISIILNTKTSPDFPSLTFYKKEPDSEQSIEAFINVPNWDSFSGHTVHFFSQWGVSVTDHGNFVPNEGEMVFSPFFIEAGEQLILSLEDTTEYWEQLDTIELIIRSVV